jgi:hypothetical protein
MAMMDECFPSEGFIVMVAVLFGIERNGFRHWLSVLQHFFRGSSFVVRTGWTMDEYFSS